MPINIALIGKMRSGKDVCASYLIEHYAFHRYAFGDGIRNICRQLYPEQMKDEKPRALLQGVGQSLRQFDNNVWINFTLGQIGNDRSMELVDNVVISDVRQPNEHERLKSEGYVFVRVNCGDDTRRQRMIEAGDNFTESDLTHETEQHVDLFPVHYDVYNTGGFTALYQQLDVIMRDVLRKYGSYVDMRLSYLAKEEENLIRLSAMYETSYSQRELTRVRGEIRLLQQLKHT